jgi:hypothetical protein
MEEDERLVSVAVERTDQLDRGDVAAADDAACEREADGDRPAIAGATARTSPLHQFRRATFDKTNIHRSGAPLPFSSMLRAVLMRRTGFGVRAIPSIILSSGREGRKAALCLATTERSRQAGRERASCHQSFPAWHRVF